MNESDNCDKNNDQNNIDQNNIDQNNSTLNSNNNMNYWQNNNQTVDSKNNNECNKCNKMPCENWYCQFHNHMGNWDCHWRENRMPILATAFSVFLGSLAFQIFSFLCKYVFVGMSCLMMPFKNMLTPIQQNVYVARDVDLSTKRSSGEISNIQTVSVASPSVPNTTSGISVITATPETEKPRQPSDMDKITKPSDMDKITKPSDMDKITKPSNMDNQLPINPNVPNKGEDLSASDKLTKSPQDPKEKNVYVARDVDLLTKRSGGEISNIQTDL